MKILVLDDDPARHAAFADAFEGNEVIHVTLFEDFCDILTKSDQFDLIHFDHDLGILEPRNIIPGAYGQDVEMTGADAARYMVGQIPEEKWPKRAVVHSWNPAGATRIMTILRDHHIPAVYEPFQPPPEEP